MSSFQTLPDDIVANAPVAEPTPVKLSVRDLDFYYGKNKTLNSISIDFHDRAVTALIGCPLFIWLLRRN